MPGVGLGGWLLCDHGLCVLFQGDLIMENGYIAFYNGKQIEVYASSSYAAHCQAVKLLKVKKSQDHMVTVVLCEKDEEQVTHTAGSI